MSGERYFQPTDAQSREADEMYERSHGYKTYDQIYDSLGVDFVLKNPEEELNKANKLINKASKVGGFIMKRESQGYSEHQNDGLASAASNYLGEAEKAFKKSLGSVGNTMSPSEIRQAFKNFSTK